MDTEQSHGKRKAGERPTRGKPEVKGHKGSDHSNTVPTIFPAYCISLYRVQLFLMHFKNMYMLRGLPEDTIKYRAAKGKTTTTVIVGNFQDPPVPICLSQVESGRSPRPLTTGERPVEHENV